MIGRFKSFFKDYQYPMIPLFTNLSDLSNYIDEEYIEEPPKETDIGIERTYNSEIGPVFLTLWNNSVHCISYHVAVLSTHKRYQIVKELLTFYGGKEGWLKPKRTDFTTFYYRDDLSYYATISHGPGLMYKIAGNLYSLSGIPTFRSHAFVDAQHENREVIKLKDVIDELKNKNIAELATKALQNETIRFYSLHGQAFSKPDLDYMEVPGIPDKKLIPDSFKYHFKGHVFDEYKSDNYLDALDEARTLISKYNKCLFDKYLKDQK